MSSLFDLAGKVALVTGGTKGIGRSIAKGYAMAGAEVVITGRRQDGCDGAAAELNDELDGQTVRGIGCHMGEWDQIDALVERVYGELGRVDVLVNNAAINPAPVTVAECTEAYFDKVYAVNVKGPIRLAGLVAPRMGESGGGSIINVTTMGAYSGGPRVSIYTSSKAALHNLTRAMAAEWAELNVKVNAIAPGPFMSEMMKGSMRFDPEFPARSGQATMMKRVADCDEIIGLALYLASDASSYVTGHDFKIAGGM